MPFLSPVGAADDADEFYFGYDAGYHRSSGGGGGKSAKKEKGFLSCLPCFCKPLGLGLSWFFNRFVPGAFFFFFMDSFLEFDSIPVFLEWNL
jgi:hypothetical protein